MTKMKPIPFDPAIDLAPIQFDEGLTRLAQEMKQNGLSWKPHVGCFVWDPLGRIEPDSPFPARVYFILSLPRFLDLFGSLEAMTEELVWLPTWHQGRLLCRKLAIDDEQVADLWRASDIPAPGEELKGLYRLILECLKRTRRSPKTIPAAKDAAKERLAALCAAAIRERLGRIDDLPQDTMRLVEKTYRDFIEVYVEILRMRNHRPAGWMPESLVLDDKVLEGMRHFFSDYQHITRHFLQLNERLDALRKIDRNRDPQLFQEQLKRIRTAGESEASVLESLLNSPG
jgi:hypothetical protein